MKIEVPKKVPQERTKLVKIYLSGSLLDYVASKKLPNEPFSKAVIKIIKFMMFLDRYASENRRVSELLRYAYRRGRELGVL